MIARWPGTIKAGQVSQQIWALWDFLPTAAAIAGEEAPRNIDGISMLPALLGKRQAGHHFLYWEFHEGGYVQAVRMGNWKAVRRGGNGPVELYDLDTDLRESRDLALTKPALVRRLVAIMNREHVESDHWPTTSDFKPN